MENKTLSIAITAGIAVVSIVAAMLIVPIAIVQGYLSNRKNLPVGIENIIAYAITVFLMSKLMIMGRDAGPFGDSITYSIFFTLAALLFYVPPLLIVNKLTKNK